MDRRWYSPGALRCSPHLMLALPVVLVVVACSGARSRPATPCMSDNECRSDRICHEGKCRFVEEVLAELASATLHVGRRTAECTTAQRERIHGRRRTHRAE